MFSKNYKIGFDRLKGNTASITQLVDIAQSTSISITNTTSRNVKWYLDNNQGWVFLNCSFWIVVFGGLSPSAPYVTNLFLFFAVT